MKVPSPVTGRTRSPNAQLTYIQGASNPTAGLSAIAKGMNSLGAQLEVRNEKTDRFSSLQSFSQFQTDAAVRMTELKRDYPANGKDFAEKANETYGQLEDEWIAKIPPAMQEEFRYRSSEVRRNVVGDAFKFQYEAGDAWFRQGISDELSKSKTIIDQTPEALATEQQRIFEVIAASDLPEIEKEELQRQATIGLAAVTYKTEVRRDVGTRGSLGIGDPTSVVDRIIGVESRGKTGAQNPNSSAGGLGQFLDSTWLGMVRKYKPEYAGASDQEILAMKKGNPALNREMTTRFTEENQATLARNGITPTNGNTYLAHFLGAGDAVKVLKASPDTPLKGLISDASIASNQSVLEGKTAGDARSWANRKMGNAALATDPRFADIPYEDRVALYEDAERDVAAQQREQAAQQKAARDAAQNELYLGLLDGNRGKLDIDNARANGTLNDFDSVSKALQILKDRDGEISLANNGLAKLQAGGIFDPADTDDKKMLNAVVKQSKGLDLLTNKDENYFTSAILPMVQQSGDVPTDVSGLFTGMVRSADNGRMAFALDSMAQIRDLSPQAFNQRFSEDVAQQVDLWDAMKDVSTDEKELLDLVRGGTTQTERQQRAVLRKEAQSLLAREVGGVPKGQALLDEAVGEFGWSPAVSVPLARQSFSREFNTHFIDAYSKTGNEDVAKGLALKAVQRTWGQTEVGGGNDLMKFPPEKAGYRPLDGSYDWINESVRTELALTPEQDFDLFSDEQTRQEFQTFQGNPTASPPSYRVFIKDESGVYREAYDERGLPRRMNFKPSEEQKTNETLSFDRKARKFNAEETIREYEQLRAGSNVNPLAPLAIPEEDTQAYERAIEELRVIESEDNSKAARKPNMTTGGAMPGGGLFGDW